MFSTFSNLVKDNKKQSIYQYMSMNQKQLEELIDKLVNLNSSKPKGVDYVDCVLIPLGIRNDEYYLNITYVVPDDSPYLTKHLTGRQLRAEWNESIKGTIYKYLRTNVLINSSSISSESFYNKHMN